jgi:hypothetical protein
MGAAFTGFCPLVAVLRFRHIGEKVPQSLIKFESGEESDVSMTPRAVGLPQIPAAAKRPLFDNATIEAS